MFYSICTSYGLQCVTGLRFINFHIVYLYRPQQGVIHRLLLAVQTSYTGAALQCFGTKIWLLKSIFAEPKASVSDV